MTGLSHAMLSWAIGQGGGGSLRDRRLIAWLGVAPDIDSIAYLAGTLPRLSIDDGYQLYVEVHHHYTHGMLMVLAAMLAAGALGARKLRASLLAGLAVLLHLACDLVGSGPEFPIYPWWPLDRWLTNASVAWTAPWSVPVQDWPNLLAGFALLLAAFGWGVQIRRTPLEMISRRMDEELLRHFGRG